MLIRYIRDGVHMLHIPRNSAAGWMLIRQSTGTTILNSDSNFMSILMKDLILVKIF